MVKTIEEMEGLIYLEDGTVFKGIGFGARGTAVGELVFNTSMTGYQKILTDPSYKGQIITMTYPLIGNYGVSDIDNESDGIHAFGLVIKDLCDMPSNSNSVMSLDQWLREQKVPGVFGVDTRQITKKIRKFGTVKCLISTEDISIAEAKELCSKGELRGDWMKEASTKEKYVLEPTAVTEEKPYEVAVLDFGVKTNILRCLQVRNCRLTVYPYGTPAAEILQENPDGIFLTNGPGDPEEAKEAIEEVHNLIRTSEVPMFGICMGHQILALALGGKTYKLKYGHRGGNHPVKNLKTGKIEITSQNHSYAVDYASLKNTDLEMTHINLLDHTVEGIACRKDHVFSVQYHPESAPGPQDSGYLFDQFIQMMEENKHGKAN